MLEPQEMKQSPSTSSKSSANPLQLCGAVVNYLIQVLPAGTAHSIGVVLIVMMTGRLVHTKGSLARAVFPLVCSLKWGWHRVERSMERGKVSIDELLERAFDWCMATLPVEPVRIGPEQREVNAIDSSTIARWRAQAGMDLLGKGYDHRAGKAVKANIIAIVTTVVMIAGVRVGMVRRVRFGLKSKEAVAKVFADLPEAQGKRLLVVDAGIATKEQFSQATDTDALLGRLRINSKLRCAPAPRPPKPGAGRPPIHGAVLHPGAEHPEVDPDQEINIQLPTGVFRVRRWNHLHFEEDAHTILDVVRIDDPEYDKPLLIGTGARELSTGQIWKSYGHRAPVETNFFVAQDTAAMEMPRAWTEHAIKRRIALALLVGYVLKAIASVCEPLAMGPWDRKPQRTAGRLAHYLDMRVEDFRAVALKGVNPINYRKIQNPQEIEGLPLPAAA